MGKKKAGSLSDKMIVRRGPAEKTGFIVDPAPQPKEASGKAAPSSVGGAQIPVPKKPQISPSSRPQATPAPDPPTTVTISRLSTLKGNLQAASHPDAKVVALYPSAPDPSAPDPSAPDPSAPVNKPSHSDDGFPAPVVAGTTGDRLVQALRKADIAEAEEVFAEMTGLGHVSVLQLLYGPDGRRLAMACRALGMEQLQFVSVYILSRKLGLGEESLDPRELARIVALFEATDRVEATTMLAAWQAEPDGGVRLSPEPS